MGCRDLISSLPDEILCKILSYLCTYGAVSTAVLSRRWRKLHLLVDRLDLSDARGDPRYFCDFVDRTLDHLRNSNSLKSFSLTCASTHDDSRVNKWIDTVLKGGFLELDLHIEDMCIDIGFFTSDTLLHLSLCEFHLEGSLSPGGVFFPKLKTLSLVHVDFSSSEMYDGFISGCPVLEDFCLEYCDDNINPPTWNGVVVSPSIKRLTIFQHWPHNRDAHEGCCFDTPSLVYLDYSSYVCQEYEVNLASLTEARLDIQSWERRRDEDESDEENYENGEAEHIFGDVTDLVAGISTVKTLYLSANSLEVFHLCCKSMPVFHNLLTLSFESDKEIGWQVVPLLLNNSPNLETLVMKGLVHEVTDKCGDACPCILKTKRKKKKKKKKKKEKGACCLSTCQVKVLNISRYHGTSEELKQMRHFLRNLKCLETVKVDIEVNRDKDANDTYLRITDALMKLPRVSSNCRIHFS